MRINLFLTFCLAGLLAVNPVFACASNDNNVKSFWEKFRTAVIKKDKNTVAAMTKFPLSMPFGQKSVRSKTELLRRYKQVFDGETDSSKCFVNAELETNDAGKSYGVYCGFRKALDDENNKPIYYYFEKTKTGWKFAGLDNINE